MNCLAISAAILSLFVRTAFAFEPPLVAAAHRGDAAAVRRLLASGESVESSDEHGLTALMYASVGDHREIVEALLAAGARVDASADKGVTALLLAAVGGPHLDVMRDLLQAGARLEELTRQFQNPRPEIRVKTVMAFAVLHPGPEAKDAVPALAEALGDHNLNVRYWAADALRSIGPQAREAVPRLIQALKTDPESEPGLEGPYRYYADARAAAAEALGEIGFASEDVVLALRSATADKNELVRENAAKALDLVAKRGASAPEGAIIALPLPPVHEPLSAPVLIDKSVSWTSRSGGSVGYQWKAALKNEDSRAEKVTLLLRLRDSDGKVIHQDQTEIVLDPRARMTVTREGAMPEEVASRAAYWTFDIGDVSEIRPAETSR